MTDLDHMLAENQAPAARASLSTRILAATDTAAPANDGKSTRRPLWAYGGIAAMAVIAAVFWFQLVDDSATDWNQIADASGFGDLYAWVEGD